MSASLSKPITVLRGKTNKTHIHTYKNTWQHARSSFSVLSLKRRSQVNWGESHVVFVSFLASCQCQADFLAKKKKNPKQNKKQHMVKLHPTIIGWSARPEVPWGAHVITLPEMTFLHMNLTHPVSAAAFLFCFFLFLFFFYASYNNVIQPAVHLRLNCQLNVFALEL